MQNCSPGILLDQQQHWAAHWWEIKERIKRQPWHRPAASCSLPKPRMLFVSSTRRPLDGSYHISVCTNPLEKPIMEDFRSPFFAKMTLLVDLLHSNFSCWEPLKIWISWVGYDTKSLWRQRVRIVKIWIRRARETIQDLRGAKGARHDRDQLNLQIRQNQGSQKIWEFIQISQTVHCAGQTEDWAHKKTRSLASVPHPVQHDDPF